MKTQKIKTLSWVSGLFMLSLFLISPDALAQKNKGQKGKNNRGLEKHPGYGHPSHGYNHPDNHHYYGDGYAYNDGYHNNNYPVNNGTCGTAGPSYQVYTNPGNVYHPNHNNRRLRVGSELNRLPPKARRVWIRGRKFYTFRGLLWKEVRTPRGRRLFRAVDRLR